MIENRRSGEIMSSEVGWHKSVLLSDVTKALDRENIRDEWVLDGTLGDGGYALEVFKRGGRVFGVDADPSALERSERRFKERGIEQDRFKLVQGNFRDVKYYLKFAGAILDLGVSSLQLDSPERGFSFAGGGPLDMRMDPGLSVKALDLVNGLNVGELAELFTKLGEESFAKPIAKEIVKARGIKKIESTEELASLVVRKIPSRIATRSVAGRHPATKVFQALRIAVNDELNALKEGLPQILEVTNSNGFILVISFHSLEDRIVKNTFREWQELGQGRILTDKPIVAEDAEVLGNPRSRSAKLRIFKRNDNSQI